MVHGWQLLQQSHANQGELKRTRCCSREASTSSKRGAGTQQRRSTSAERRQPGQPREDADEEMCENECLLMEEKSSTRTDEGEKPWWKHGQLLIVIAGYGNVVLLFNAMDELVPLFSSAPRISHGLGLSASELSWPLSCAGATLVMFALLVYPPLQRRLGVHRACRLGLACAAPAVMLVPFMSLLPLRGPALLAMMGGCLAWRAAAGVVAMTGSMIMINLSAPAGQIGAVNGAGNTMAAFNRAMGPVMCGQIWGQLVSRVNLPYIQFMPFGLVAVLMLTTCVMYSWVRLTF